MATANTSNYHSLSAEGIMPPADDNIGDWEMVPVLAHQDTVAGPESCKPNPDGGSKMALLCGFLSSAAAMGLKLITSQSSQADEGPLADNDTNTDPDMFWWKSASNDASQAQWPEGPSFWGTIPYSVPCVYFPGAKRGTTTEAWFEAEAVISMRTLESDCIPWRQHLADHCYGDIVHASSTTPGAFERQLGIARTKPDGAVWNVRVVVRSHNREWLAGLSRDQVAGLFIFDNLERIFGTTGRYDDPASEKVFYNTTRTEQTPKREALGNTTLSSLLEKGMWCDLETDLPLDDPQLRRALNENFLRQVNL
ncbi:hypothetical protein V8F33_008170 [Rhypophila sp. PSN 637]